MELQAEQEAVTPPGKKKGKRKRPRKGVAKRSGDDHDDEGSGDAHGAPCL